MFFGEELGYQCVDELIQLYIAWALLRKTIRLGWFVNLCAFGIHTKCDMF
jgi:hypothetical protein